MKERRLLIVSSRVRNKSAILASIHDNGIYTVEYNFETMSLEDIISLASENLRNDKVVSIAFILHSSEKELFLCRPGEAKISLKTMIGDPHVRNFFTNLVSAHLDVSDSNARIDFLASYAAEHVDGGLISKELESLLNVEVGISSNLQGSDIQVVQKGNYDSKNEGPTSVGGMYFNLKNLEASLSKAGTVSKDGASKLKCFDKIRLVGKGAFGNAILYQRQIDGLFVIIKEINMLELSASDRALALNEVKVLAKMDHPNIVAYFDSFEVDGVLMIEMEYADGGNLADDLEKRTCQMRELEILDIFGQMVSAIRHMHSHNVLHRDLKTANIFLTKERTVKIGDFGISKVLSTQHGVAMTVLGTPYYISPEMCEGKIYDEKSDIWALGCILYEMACLQKTFEGANLPALVNKITRGQFAPIRGNYSPLFKQLVRDLLQRDPDFRPTASHVMLVRLPELIAFNETLRVQEEEEERDAFILQELDQDPESILTNEIGSSGILSISMQKPKACRPARSVLYDLKGHESGLRLTPIQLPSSIRIVEVSASGTHFIALSSEFLVYTWGQGSKGQLGHGVLLENVETPRCVDSLKAKSITKVCAGEGFSVFASDSGILMTCGDGSFGCLGHGDWNSCGTPKLIETLLSVDVSAISCGAEHVVMVDTKGDVFSWGRGSYGRLGQGHEDDSCSPKKMELKTEEIYIVNVKCNGNGTMLLCDKGTLYSCGENRYNRLGLDDQPFYMFGSHVDKALVPTKISSVRKKYKIVDYDMGIDHTVCITHDGKVVSFGKNTDGQLGRGHTRNLISEGGSPEYVKSLTDKEVCFVSCGPTFTLTGTNENVIYVWGTRHHAISGDGTHTESDDLTMKDVILEPTELLALYASEQHLQRGETVVLSGILARSNHDILIWVETTCPLPRPSTNKSSKCSNGSQYSLSRKAEWKRMQRGEIFNDKSRDVPYWLEAELNTTEVKQISKKPSPVHKNRESLRSKPRDEEKFKKLENDYQKKKQEILLEAEAAVRVREKALNNEVHRLREELDKQKGSTSNIDNSKQSFCSLQ